MMGSDRRCLRRASSPRVWTNRWSPEALEDRVLLSAANGGRWAYGSRITYSLVPDGTSVGGTPSALFSTMNAKFATATWQEQIQKAAALWSAVADINLVQVPDSGAALGTSGNQQGDSRFGDIRIGATSQASSQLGFAFSPPPINGGTLAGDFLFNSATNWQINAGYDLLTVAVHEFGHALGMAHSAIASAEMYACYNAVKQSLTSDDIAGIRSIYGAKGVDSFDASASNNSQSTPTDITAYLDSNAKLALPGLTITTTTDYDWYKVTVPASTSGKLVVAMQSRSLSSQSPRVQVYSAALTSVGLESKANTYGDTATVTVSGVSAGQTYLIRASAANSGATGVGGYGLSVNLGSTTSSSISPPGTTVASQPDAGGGSSAQSDRGGRDKKPNIQDQLGDVAPDSAGMVQIGSLFGWGEAFTTHEGGHGHEGGHHHVPVDSLGAAQSSSLLLYALPVDQVLPGLAGDARDIWGRPRKRA